MIKWAVVLKLEQTSESTAGLVKTPAAGTLPEFPFQCTWGQAHASALVAGSLGRRGGGRGAAGGATL